MAADGLVVAVTGPTGEIGIPFLRALEATPGVAEIRGMARRPFDPAAHGWTRTRYLRGDVLDRSAVDQLVEGADVVVHLAFIIFGSPAQSRQVNLQGSRNVFEAAVDAGVSRLVYTSSVAAYGFHTDNPQPLDEDVPTTGTDDFYYSAQKAELESTLATVLAGSDVAAHVLRPSVVGGPDSPALVANVPYVGTPPMLPGAIRALVERVPGTGPVVLDPGTPMQLVHADDVARALVTCTLGDGPPGVYNLAAPGEFTMGDLARALGWRSVRVPRVSIDVASAATRRVPGLPPQVDWIQAARVPVLMDTRRAQQRLGWQPQHDAAATLQSTVAGARQRGLVDTLGRRTTR